MCGIAGIVALDARPVDRAAVARMLDGIVHRGPDAHGLYEGPGIAAGIRRLRVVDLATGDQPIANEDGTVEVVFNGEIYGFTALREELEGRGHRFRTRSDTEVLVHLWEEHGLGMLDRLNGMFAFCLLDRRTGDVLIARDPMGIKPLYLRETPAGLAFASELPPLLALPGPRPSVDAERLLDLFLLQYVPGDATVHAGITTLAPGHLLLRRDGRWDRRRYASPAHGGDAQPGAARRLRELLEDAVRLQKVADVPVGVFLSGGLDSTAVAALLSRETGAVETFSVGFPDPRHDESGHAAAAAAAVGSRHHALRLDAGETAARLPELVRHLGEPLVDPALIPTWLLSKFARERVTVVLTGEGADELFGGYRRYRWQRRYGAGGRLPGARALARWLPRRAAQAVEALSEPDPALSHLAWASTCGPAFARTLFGDDRVDRWRRSTRERFAPYFDGVDRVEGSLRADLATWLPNNLLSKVDRASMAFSLEARVPFLDRRIVDLASRLPLDAKVTSKEGKIVLRRAVADLVPPSVLRRPKRGFDLPLAAWLRGPLAGPASERFASGALERGLGLREGAARRLLDDHRAGRVDAGLPLFSLLSIAIFLDDHA
ncbi:MAG TPA: asparagine synthase (glutamine-hydrolyzing) [Candidatus Polarisedimenticolaceae bacterium]